MGNRKLTALALLSLALCAISAIVAGTSSSTPHPGVWAAIAALTGGALLGVGLYAWRRGGQGRFGQVLFGTGLCWFLASLATSDSDLLYSIGRVSGWIFEVALIYALVSYPTGRLETRGARTLAGAAALVVLVLYLPTIPFVGQYPLPTTFTGCLESCPANTFYSGAEPSLIDSVVKPVREVITVAVFASVAVLLAVRLRSASHSLKRTLVPVLGAAILRFAGATAYIALRRGGADDEVMEVARLVTVLTIPATALGFLVGILQWRLYSAGALARLTTKLGATKSAADLRELLADSLAEPQAALYYAPPGAHRWLDSAGQPVVVPAPSATASVKKVETESGLRVALVCDRGFDDYPDFLGAISSCVVSGLERQRLDAALHESLANVAASRKRLAGAADEARRQIERDLHDGAQQRLVALRVKLELAREALKRDPDGAGELIASLGPEVEEIIDGVRSLARGIYPPLLASDGLGEALRAVGQRSPLPVAIDAAGVGRFPQEIESAVYFCCLEALQNAAKHATGATMVRIKMRSDGGLRFEVDDDGCGFAADGPEGAGSGILGMRDRLAAVGGQIRIESKPGSGTRVCGTVPAGWPSLTGGGHPL